MLGIKNDRQPQLDSALLSHPAQYSHHLAPARPLYFAANLSDVFRAMCSTALSVSATPTASQPAAS